MSTNRIMDTNPAGHRRNKRWPESVKREIVAASYGPGVSVSMVARTYDVNANQVFAWRKRFAEGEAGPSLVPVTITPEPVVAGDDKIEIISPRGFRIVIGSDFEAVTLRRVLDVLEER